MRYLIYILIGGLLMGMPSVITAEADVTIVEQPTEKVDIQLDKWVERAEKAGLSAVNVRELIQRSQKKGLEEEQIVALIEPAVLLAEQDLPGRMVLQKAFEGLAKGVPPNRIQPVILNLKQRIQRAQKVVDPWLEDNNTNGEKRFITEKGRETTLRNVMIEATAQALGGPSKPSDIKDFLKYLDEQGVADKVTSGQIAAAIRVLSDLVTTQEYPKLTQRMLKQALNAGFSASDLHQLPNAVKLARQQSRLPAKAVAAGFTRQIEEGITAKQIIQNLQSGNVKGGELPPRLKKQRKGPDQNPAADKKKDGG